MIKYQNAILTCILLSLNLSVFSFAQPPDNILEKRITINIQDVALKEALKQMGRADERIAGTIAANYANILDETLGFFSGYLENS